MWNIPKNASTATKAYLKMGTSHYQPHDSIMENAGFSHIKRYELFAIVRNPVDRWFSTYRYLALGMMNGIDYGSFVGICQGMLQKGQTLYDFNNHLVTQCEHISAEVPKYVITMEELDKAFPGIAVKNSTGQNKEPLEMPKEIKEYYANDFKMYNYYKHETNWQELKKYLKLDR